MFNVCEDKIQKSKEVKLRSCSDGKSDVKCRKERERKESWEEKGRLSERIGVRKSSFKKSEEKIMRDMGKVERPGKFDRFAFQSSCRGDLLWHEVARPLLRWLWPPER